MKARLAPAILKDEFSIERPPRYRRLNYHSRLPDTIASRGLVAPSANGKLQLCMRVPVF